MTGPVKWWKPGLAGLALLVLLGAAATSLWLRSAPQPLPGVNLLLPEPGALAPGVYLLGQTSPAAAYAVETSDGLVLIDSGLETNAAAVLGQLARLRLDVGRLRAILLTHVHGDHSLGANCLRALTGAKVYVGRGDCQPLREGGPREAFFSIFAMTGRTPHPTPVDVELGGDETLVFGDSRFVAIATPGHTPGSICYLLERPNLRALFTGDVIQHLSTARADALGTYAVYLPPLYRGNVRDYIASLWRLRALPAPDLVLPGHPRMDDVPQSPRLPPERWRALLDQGLAELEQLRDRYETDGANFLDGSPKELLPGLHYLGAIGPAPVYCLSTPKGLFLFDAPGGPALVAFLARHFKRLGWEGRKPTAVLLTSAGEEATAGLGELVHKTGCQVVAPKADLERIRQRCPEAARLLTEEELEKSNWFEVRAIPLLGRGLTPVAYQVRWAGKTVLFSGRIPVKPSAQTAEQLLRQAAESGGRGEQYVKALDRLAEITPNLWLPAVPVHGQNANLYDNDWAKVLTRNRQFLQSEDWPTSVGRQPGDQRP